MSKQTLSAGDLLVRIGAILFVIGAFGTIATVAPLLLGTDPLPTPAYFVSMLMGVGLAVALVGLLRTALAQRQSAAADGAGAPLDRGDAGGGGGAGGGGSAGGPGGPGQAAAEV